jgi:phosphoribosyl-dephospho-CoA transferase
LFLGQIKLHTTTAFILRRTMRKQKALMRLLDIDGKDVGRKNIALEADRCLFCSSFIVYSVNNS